MRIGIRIAAGLALTGLFALPAAAQDRGALTTTSRAPVSAAASGEREPLADLIHCLRVLDLDEAQKMAIDQFIETEKPTLQALRDARQADRQTLRSDAGASPPDPCKVGADFLKVVSDREAIRAEVGKIKTFIESQLNDRQKARFDGCLLGSRGPNPAATGQ